MKIPFEDHNPDVDVDAVAKELSVIGEEAARLHNVDVYKQCLSFVDYTSLNATDTPAVGKSLAERVNHFSAHYANIPNVAAICVYPSLVDAVRLALTAKDVKIAAVGAGFPAAQTFLHIKKAECKMAVDVGAAEVDIVMSLGRFLSGDYSAAFNEILSIKTDAVGKDHCLKVILETGLIPSLTLVRSAGIGCMMAGADFLKTSTGKVAPAATPEAALVMCRAIKDFYGQTKIKTGFKAAGGIATAADAVMYYAIVKHVLGEEWLTPSLFRIGASRLANSLLSNITGKEERYF
jgi:deoxyribose-phosphate aldolase